MCILLFQSFYVIIYLAHLTISSLTIKPSIFISYLFTFFPAPFFRYYSLHLPYYLPYSLFFLQFSLHFSLLITYHGIWLYLTFVSFYPNFFSLRSSSLLSTLLFSLLLHISNIHFYFFHDNPFCPSITILFDFYR